MRLLDPAEALGRRIRASFGEAWFESIGESPLDPTTFALITMTITVVALLASAIPAWRAARLDPIDALRRD